MSQARARTWSPPTELIIDWSDVLSLNPSRFGVARPEPTGHRLSVRDESPSKCHGRVLATLLGLSERTAHVPLKVVRAGNGGASSREDGSLGSLTDDYHTAWNHPSWTLEHLCWNTFACRGRYDPVLAF
jgi:hypothetical protein